MADADITIVRIAPETSFKNKAYEALKEAILKMDKIGRASCRERV